MPRTGLAGSNGDLAESSASAEMYKDADKCIGAHGTVMHASGWCA